jgi:hypothetical protein
MRSIPFRRQRVEMWIAWTRSSPPTLPWPATTTLGAQPIHAATSAGSSLVVELLMSRGVSLGAFLAADFGMLERIEAAIRDSAEFPAAFGPGGSTALHRACYWGQIAVVRTLLAHGAGPNAVTRDRLLRIHPLGCAVATPGVPSPSDKEDTVLELVGLMLGHDSVVTGGVTLACWIFCWRAAPTRNSRL